MAPLEYLSLSFIKGSFLALSKLPFLGKSIDFSLDSIFNQFYTHLAYFMDYYGGVFTVAPFSALLFSIQTSVTRAAFKIIPSPFGFFKSFVIFWQEFQDLIILC